MHVGMLTKQRLAIFKFCPVSNFSFKKLGGFRIVRVQASLHTFCIGFVLFKHVIGVISSAVTSAVRLSHDVFWASFYRLVTEYNDSHTYEHLGF